jgi:hypothetical protein
MLSVCRKQAKRGRSTPRYNPYDQQLPAGFTAYPGPEQGTGQPLAPAQPAPLNGSYYPPQAQAQQPLQNSQPQYNGACTPAV